MADLTGILGKAWTAEKPPKADPPEEQLRSAMISAGIEPPDIIEMDGRLRRFASGTSGRGPGSGKPGWYVAFSDGMPAARFGCFRAGLEATWRAEGEWTAEQEMVFRRRMQEAQQKRDEIKEALTRNASEVVSMIWEEAAAASAEHPYLARKQIKPNGARTVPDGRLVVPLYSVEGELTSLQYIAHDGEKRYHPDGTTQGSFWMLGEPEGTVYLAEGFATAATIHEITGNACLVAFSAHALPQVAKIWRERFPDSDLRIVADNDASGTGLMYASQAAAKHNATLIEIPIEGDANDYHLAGGDLLGLLNPPEEEAWLVAADDFAADPRPIPWLVKDWVQDEALIMVHGPSGGGKTFLVLDWALHIASIPHGERGEWGSSTVESGGVVYLAGEGHFGLRARISAWKQQHQPQNRLRMWLSRSGCDLNKDSGFRQAAQQIRKLPEKPRLIVVDTLHRFLNGDENSSQDAKTMLDACSRLMQEFSCSVLLVHHTGVNDENQHRARGSSAWRAALDIEISVVPPKRKNTPLQVVQRKSKDSELAPPIHGEIVPIALVGTCGDSGEPVKSAVFQLVDSDEVLQNLDPKVSDFRSKFEGAWRQSGKEMVDGVPYVTRSALKAYLVDGGMSSRSATNTLDGYNYPKMMIGTLTTASLVTACNQGWKVIDQKTIEMMLL